MVTSKVFWKQKKEIKKAKHTEKDANANAVKLNCWDTRNNLQQKINAIMANCKIQSSVCIPRIVTFFKI